MKFFLVISAIVLTAQCAPQVMPPNVNQVVPLNVNQVVPPNVNQIVPQFEMSPNGEYKFRYQTPDDQIRSEQGFLVQRPGANGVLVPVIVVSGFYSYIGSDGVLNVNEYTADVNGFQSKISKHGSHVSPSSIVRPVLPSSTVRPVSPSSTVRPVSPSSTVRPVSPSSIVHPVAQLQTPNTQLHVQAQTPPLAVQAQTPSFGTFPGLAINPIFE